LHVLKATSKLQSNTPVKVANLQGAIAVSSGDGFTCALLHTSKVKRWDYNGDGELGDGTTKHVSNIPVKLSQLTDAIYISAAESHVCAVLKRSNAGVTMVLGLWEMELTLKATLLSEFRNFLVQLSLVSVVFIRARFFTQARSNAGVPANRENWAMELKSNLATLQSS
jgi:hypothetical protein